MKSVVVLLLAGFSAAPLLAQGRSVRKIISVYSQKALDQDMNVVDAAQVWDFHGGNNQLWELRPVRDNIVEIRNLASGKCLDIQANNVDIYLNGHYAHFWECHGGDNQRFAIEQVGNDEVLIRPMHTRKCLDITDWDPNNGANLQQWDCHRGENQRWVVAFPF